MEEGLIEINIETVRQLRYEGHYGVAAELLEAYHENRKKSKIQDSKNLLKRDRLIRKHLGLCSHVGCNHKAAPGKSSCQNCLGYYAKLNRKRVKAKND